MWEESQSCEDHSERKHYRGKKWEEESVANEQKEKAE